MDSHKGKIRRRVRRQKHVRRNMFGNPEKPRLAVFRSNKHIYCQLVDDSSGRTLVCASTMDRDLRSSVPYGGNNKSARAVGTTLAERAKKAGIEKVVFDRRCYKFHGRIKALADGARKGGLKF